MSVQDILDDIDAQQEMLVRTRALFPYVGGDKVGQTSLRTAPFYRARGYDVTFGFAQPLTSAQIDSINEVGYWINQNYILRLYALLNYHGLVSETVRIDSNRPGHKEMDILRRLRHKFAHTRGWCNTDEPEEVILRARIVSHFGLDMQHRPESESQFPLPIDEVLLPLTAGCREYVIEKLAKEHPDIPGADSNHALSREDGSDTG